MTLPPERQQLMGWINHAVLVAWFLAHNSANE